MTTPPETHAEPCRLEGLDPYARRGVALSRDAAHRVIAALRRDAYDLGTRPCAANDAAADEQYVLAQAIGEALNCSPKEN